MGQELYILTLTAASLGFFHTLLGPDHYLPFIVMARARKWSLARTVWITVVCGLGHILSSVVLGSIGIALGIAVLKLETVESVRGELAAWLLIAFGLVYFVWGIRRAVRNKAHAHAHFHSEEVEHIHTHVHAGSHVHAHGQEHGSRMTAWVFFTIFVFGPCEPLIPLLMYPAATNALWGVALVTVIFGGVTIMTMLGIVLVAVLGVSLVPVGRLERYTHALTGATICLCGMAIQFLGL